MSSRRQFEKCCGAQYIYDFGCTSPSTTFQLFMPEDVQTAARSYFKTFKERDEHFVSSFKEHIRKATDNCQGLMIFIFNQPQEKAFGKLARELGARIVERASNPNHNDMQLYLYSYVISEPQEDA